MKRGVASWRADPFTVPLATSELAWGAIAFTGVLRVVEIGEGELEVCSELIYCKNNA